MAALRIARHALRYNAWKVSIIVAALLISCTGRAAFAQACHPEGPPKILVLRGVFEIFSLGMNDLAHKLRSRGYDATSTSWSLALFATDCSGDRPLIVIGHSLGGRMCGWTSRLLKTCGQRVPLIIVVDANLLTPIPSNVDECLNLYVTNELGIFHGSPVYAESPHTQVVNWDVSRGQPSMFRGGVNHFDIDATDWVHEIIIREIECRFPLCSAMEEDTCEPVAAGHRKGATGSSNRFAGSNGALSAETVAVQVEFGTQVSSQVNAEIDDDDNAGSADDGERVRSADAPLVHMLHDEDDPFEVEARRNKRIQWQPTRPLRTQVANIAESTSLIERVTWEPTEPVRTEAASACKSTRRVERVPWQPTRPSVVSTEFNP